MTDPLHETPKNLRWAAGPLGLGFACLALAGCMDPLYPEKEDRSQFAGYDRARDQSVPLYVEDEFGDRRPNIRGRLLVHD